MMTTNITMDFLNRLLTVPTWPEMAYAFDNQLIPIKTVIDFAKEKIAMNDVITHDELSIASASVNDSIVEFIHNLSDRDCDSIDDHARSYWANVLLAWAYENKTSFDDFLGVVENIYADFNYPEELAPFVKYMPTDAPNLGSREANENRIVISIGEYVKEFFKY